MPTVCACHVRTPSVFFDLTFAFRTSMYVPIRNPLSILIHLILLAWYFTMCKLFALGTSLFITFIAPNILLSVSDDFQHLFAISRRTKYQVLVLSHFLIILKFQILFENLSVDDGFDFRRRWLDFATELWTLELIWFILICYQWAVGFHEAFLAKSVSTCFEVLDIVEFGVRLIERTVADATFESLALLVKHFLIVVFSNCNRLYWNSITTIE